jgi:uncharacterized protein (UPF0248 family)
MENLYRAWTIEQDRILWDNRNRQSTIQLASMLGRGLRGVELRLGKLNDVNSSAYQRLFAQSANHKKRTGDGEGEDEQQKFESSTKQKLVPASEVLRRIQWDKTLSASDFSVMHYDRVADAVFETPVNAPNHSIAGKATSFIEALPEHRIVGIKYRERVVWDREQRMDLVFGSEGIEQVVREYDAWKQQRDETNEVDRQRQADVSRRIQLILGVERYATLTELSTELPAKLREDPTRSMKIETERYVEDAQALFRQARDAPMETALPDDIQNTNDIEALEALSELVALLPDKAWRETILREISIQIQLAEGKANIVPLHRELPDLNERDLTETFVRGSGPGGQKINKTSNKVVLVHEPTQLRVEVQDTRSLPQNRKIARKRLREKLDQYYNGSQSKAGIAAKKIANKKAKTKARNRSRHRQRQEAKEQSGASDSHPASESDDDY